MWTQSHPKILFLLKENWGYQDCGIIHITDLAHGWLNDRIPTYVRITTLAAAISLSLQRGFPLTKDEISQTKEDRDILHNALDNIAVVNLKKHSGQSKSNDIEIRNEARKNAPLLHRQISDLHPTIIVAGSTVCWDRLAYDLNLFRATPSCPKHTAICHESIILCHTNHPSAWRGKGFPIEDIHINIMKAMNK